MTPRVALAATFQPWSPPRGHFQAWPAVSSVRGCLLGAGPGGRRAADILSSVSSSLAGYGTPPKSEKATTEGSVWLIPRRI